MFSDYPIRSEVIWQHTHSWVATQHAKVYVERPHIFSSEYSGRLSWCDHVWSFVQPHMQTLTRNGCRYINSHGSYILFYMEAHTADNYASLPLTSHHVLWLDDLEKHTCNANIMDCICSTLYPNRHAHVIAKHRARKFATIVARSGVSIHGEDCTCNSTRAACGASRVLLLLLLAASRRSRYVRRPVVPTV